MIKSIGIRREDKSKWERRVPLIPEHVQNFVQKGVNIVAQPSPVRCFSDSEYLEANAKIEEDLDACDLLIGVKEMPMEFIKPGKPHIFFSHTIKGQAYNMPLLKHILEQKATLIDYECIADEKNRRIIAFGYYAGLAGMIDTLSALGKRWQSQGINTPFGNIQYSHCYKNIEEAKKSIKSAVEEIQKNGLPEECVPCIIGTTGRGKVAKGVKEVLTWLSPVTIKSEGLAQAQLSNKQIGVVNFDGEDLYRHNGGEPFCFYDYRNNPEKYHSYFHEHLPYLSVLSNGIYWDERYPRLITLEILEKLFREGNLRLQVIGDISCDIEGSIECTVKATTPEDPVFMYHPINKNITSGCQGEGVAMMTVDILPAEFPEDASRYFSEILTDLLLDLVPVNFEGDLEGAGLSEHLKKAVIVWRGELTPMYEELQNFIE